MSTTTHEVQDALLGILAKDLGYTTPPRFGEAPLRHQFAWEAATNGWSEEAITGTLEAFKRQMEDEADIRDGHHRERQSLRAELAELRKDKARLDSRTIRMIHRDDLGADVAVIHMDIDLREAIDTAVEAGK